MNPTRWKITQQFALLVGLAALALVGVLGAAGWQMARMQAHIELLSGEQTERLQIAMRWRQAIAENGARVAAIAKSQDDLAPFFKDSMAAVSQQVSVDAKRYQALDTTPEGQAAVQQLLSIRPEYFAARDRILALKSIGEDASAQAQIDSTLLPVIARYNAAADALVRLQDERGHQLASSTQREARRLQQLLLGGGSATLLALLAVAAASVRSTRRSLQSAVAATQQLARGDLVQPIHVQGPAETAAVLRSLAGMQQAWAGVVSRLQTTAEGVTVASQQIAAGNHDLSNRTERAAGGLQQAVAVLTELNDAVEHNARSTQGAHGVAQEAAQAADQGKQVVDGVVQTMQQLGDASKRVGQVTEVIDALAFQTNILALNAAVEAARAGEQGRGFAVVATEVRNLAKRTAEASREVRGIIESSIEQMQRGRQQAEQAGGAMGRVTDTIGRVRSVMAELSLSAGAQSQQLAAISGTVGQLDTMTQQNAALVEEAAAAAESLRQQARALSDEVLAFKVAT